MLKKSVGRRSEPRRKASGTRERSGATIVRDMQGHRCPEREALFCFEERDFASVTK